MRFGGTGLMLPRATIGVSRWRRFRAAIDWPLIITVIALCAIGLFNLYSAVRGLRHQHKFDVQLTRHMTIGAIGFAIAVVIDYRAMLRLAWLGFAFTIALLVIVQILGDAGAAKGSARWIDVGIRLQPSELAKLMAILALARFCQEADLMRNSPATLIAGPLALFVPVGLIAIQPDLGNAVLYGLIILTVAFLVLPSVWPPVVITLSGLLTVPILWELTMHDYQKQRVLAFLDPSSDPTGNGWHTRQSIFAVGSGRTWGKGWGEGTQNQFDFLPEHWTDFPFSVWAEEWGFAGSLFLIALFGFLIVWILNVALSARDRAGAIICVGVAAMTFWHVAVNIAMVLGLAPVVGVTLPFISYGGTSLVVFLLAMGLVANVSLRRHGY